MLFKLLTLTDLLYVGDRAKPRGRGIKTKLICIYLILVTSSIAQAANSTTDTENREAAIAQSHFKQAKLQLQTGYYREAHKQALQAIDRDKKAYGFIHEKTATDFTLLASILFQLGHYSKATAFFLQSQNIRNKLFSADHIILTDNLFGLANIDQAQANYQKALLSHKNILLQRKNSLNAYHPLVIDSLLALAELHVILAQYSEADKLLSKAEDAILYKYDKNDPYYSLLLTQKGTLAAAKGHYIVAEMYQQSALDIQVKLLGRNNILVANTMVNMADRMSKNNKYTLAIPLYKEATAIYNNKLGDKNLRSAITLNHISTNYLKSRNIDKSIQTNNKAKKTARHYISAQHPFYSLNLKNQADILVAQNKFTEAHKPYQNALEINESIYGENHPEVALSLADIASLFQREKKYNKANSLYQKAVKIMQSGFAADHPALLSILDKYQEMQALSKGNEPENRPESKPESKPENEKKNRKKNRKENKND